MVSRNGDWEWVAVGAFTLLGGGLITAWFVKPEWFGRPPAPLPAWFPGAPSPEEGAEPVFSPAFNFGSNMVVTGYKKGKPITVELMDVGGGHRLAVAPAQSFIAMREAAKAVGVALIVSTSFRDMAYQQVLYARYLAGKGSLAAKPGWSNHQDGTALDLSTENGTNAAFAWLNKNALTYGWRRTVSSEPWHWEWFPASVA